MQLRKRNKFTIIANAALLDQRLSFKAKGLLALLLSRPDGWNFRVEWLVNQSQDGREAVRSGLKELEAAGYMKRQARRVEGGRLEGWVWFVTDDPADTGEGLPDEPENPDEGDSSDGLTEARETRLTVPSEDINNTELTNTELTNTDNEEGERGKPAFRLDPPPPLKDPIQQRRESHRKNLTLEESVFERIGSDLSAKLREVQEISARRGAAWYGWLREHVAPHMERLGPDFPAAVAAAVRAFHASSDPRRYGLQDFVKSLAAYTPPPKPKPTRDEQLAAILADI